MKELIRLATGRPTKPLSLVKGHRTKAEIAVREAAEKTTLSGMEMQEWPVTKKYAASHKQFIRMQQIYQGMGKDDAAYEASINRYCILHDEVLKFEAKIHRIDAAWEKAVENPDVDPETVIRHTATYTQAISKLGSDMMARRKMLLDIEKESALTLASGLRTIPKKEQPQPESAMAKFLKQRGE